MDVNNFKEIWLVDFEFRQPEGHQPEPICMVAREWRSGRLWRLWQDELIHLRTSPVPVDNGVLLVAYYASAEIGCYLSLGWPVPTRVLDLYAEFRRQTCELDVPCGNSLLGALAYFGLGAIGGVEKDSMRQLALRGGPYTNGERQALLDYCQSDVAALARLLPAMLPSMDLPRALLRGRYMVAVARMERTGTPIDVPTWSTLDDNWDAIKGRLIEQVDRSYGVYDQQSFRAERFAEYLVREDIPWPRLPRGYLALDDETFKRMAKAYPQLQPLRELRKTLSGLRLHDLAVGPDGRNRCLLSAFRTKTGRNAPSTTKFIFGLPAWLRCLIKPEENRALAYVDWEQQEFGIAAALSGDNAMMEAYESGDPYLAFAKQTGAIPPDATGQSHSAERELFKVCALAVIYGMQERSLAQQIRKQPSHARELLRLHRETYPVFWKWNDAAVDYAMLRGRLHTVFGWQVHVGPASNPRTLMNFPMQGNGAEMLRLASCLATEQGVRVCAPVHDAFLIEANTPDIESAVAETRNRMAQASRAALDGFELRSDVKVVAHPARYVDARGKDMWDTVMGILREIGTETQTVPPRPCSTAAQVGCAVVIQAPVLRQHTCTVL